MTDPAPLNTDFLERQAKASHSPIRKNIPVVAVITLIGIGIIYGAYNLVLFVANFAKIQAMKNVVVTLQKPELRDGIAMVDVTIANYNAQVIKNIGFKYNIQGPEGGSAASGKITIPDVVPVGSSRTFRHVKLGLLEGEAQRMQAELFDITLGPTLKLAPELEDQFCEAAAMKDEEAVKGFTEFVQKAPQFAPGYVGLGRAYLAIGDANKAEEALRQALKIDPSDEDAHYNLGLALEQRKDKRAAAAEFEEALKLSPDDPDVQRSLQYL